MLYIFPDNSDSAAMQAPGSSLTTTIDKATKAIKLHSIKAKPRRNPNGRNDAKYQAWLRQKEYTPFMDKVWLLLAKAEFYEADYLQAITTFMYITKIYSSNPEIVDECQLWIARAYTEMGWIYEAGNILHKMELAHRPSEKQKALYSAVKANYLIRNKEYADAVPFLQYTILKEKDKLQKLRLKYLLGQLYLANGDKANAAKAFASVSGMNTPYRFTFNAELQELQSDMSKKQSDIISSLTGMAKSEKNKDYRDQVYSAIGNIYLQHQDTAKAVENYRKAVKESTRNAYDKAAANVALGDIYFARHEFIPAQPCYAEALPLLKKSYPEYQRVSFRSGVLDELIIHAKTVYEQDSLQHLAQLPEDRRFEIINKRIEQLKKEAAAKQMQEERAKQEANQGNRISSWVDLEQAAANPANRASQTGNQQAADAQFYFYNPQTVAQGKIAFQKQWGNRKLEDDWRLSSKGGNSILDDLEADLTDSTEMKNTGNAAVAGVKTAGDDIYSVGYYLQQLPFTEEAIKQSNGLIENALFNMGKIYKDKLENMPLAIEAFNTDISRFPDTPNKEEIYYQLFLIYLQTDDHNMLTLYRNKLLDEFPKGQYATPLSDPDFEWNFRNMPLLQDSLYNSAYEAYQRADVQTVRDDYQAISTKYPFTDMMPQFAFLDALSYAQTRDSENLKDKLTSLTAKYPKADITPLATDILNRIKAGRIILSDGTPITEFDWSKAYMAAGGPKDEEGKTLAYSDSLNT
jgi:tetratricopeptide (TPR) repeat protein